MVEHNSVVVEWVKHQVGNSVTDSIWFWVVVGQADVCLWDASWEIDSLPQMLSFEESSSIRWCDQIAAADGKMKMYVVEMNREGLLDMFLDTIARPGL